MHFKDIVNRDIVNLENCEQEPIHIPGSIQPHGFLIAVTSKDWVINFCSENCADYIKFTHQQILDKKFETVFGINIKEALVKYIDENFFLTSTFPLQLSLFNKDILCSISKNENGFIFEFEPMMEEDSQPNTYSQTKRFLSFIEQTFTLQQLCNSVAKETRNVTGFDRVMIYKFDEQYNGEIFAEAKRDDLEPFLGLHYPHTDIPPQARALYLKNLLRLIADINYMPVPLFTVDTGKNANLDLSDCILRSTSPIHVQYLQNMGVGATLTISLIHKNKLWGLIACHHYSAKNLSHPSRIAAQLHGHFLTSQIEIRQSNEEYEVSRKTNDALEKFLSLKFEPTYDSLINIVQTNHLLDVCNASGCCIILDDHIYKNGNTPSDNDLKWLSKILAASYKKSGFISSHLSSQIEDAVTICNAASGIIYHSLSPSDDSCIIWFRPESINEVSWAGDPSKAIIKDEKGLHPRNSFRLWKEVVKCRSKPWLQPEMNAAANYAYTLQKHVTLIELSEEEERYKKLSEILRENNDELENINWISTHDLQEPLRKIQLMSSLFLSKGSSISDKEKAELVSKMNNSAGKMQTLLKDLLNYSKIKNAEEIYTEVDLEKVLAEIKEEYDHLIQSKRAVINMQHLPVIQGIVFLLKQLFSNLITNALKFSSNERSPVINIEMNLNDTKKNFYEITISDNGIGFDEKFAESIFKIFHRLHSQAEFKGSGIGLALSRKIMKIHKGFISAKSETGKGSTFILLFPKK